MIQKIGIAGSGQMGTGIAQLFAQGGYSVVVVKITSGDPEEKRKEIQSSLKKLVEKGKVSREEMEATLSRLTFSTHLRDIRDADLVIESIVEDLSIKKKLFAELDEVVKPEGIFATNTSTLSVEELSQAVTRKEKFFGIHFFNPPLVMKLVEVIPTLESSKEDLEAILQLLKKIGKTPIVVKDETGFIVNRLLTPYLVDAIRCYERGLAEIDHIDQAMKMGTNHPMGPFELADYIGLDIVLHMAENLWNAYREPRLAPPPLLVRLVRAGHLGRKTELGFYDYREKPPRPRDLR